MINLFVATLTTLVDTARADRKAALSRSTAEPVIKGDGDVKGEPPTEPVEDRDARVEKESVAEVYDRQKDSVSHLWDSPEQNNVRRSLFSIYVDSVDDIKPAILALGVKAQILGAWSIDSGEAIDGYPVSRDLYTFQRDRYQYDENGVATLVKHAESNADLDQVCVLFGQEPRQWS